MNFPKLTCGLIAAATLTATASARPWTDEVIYFVMTDRFFDGDPSNNEPAGRDPALHDPEQKDINRYHGGDLRGLENALRSGYFNDLGISALWLTPVVKNVWRSGYDLGGWKTGYHGYWTQDWLDIDPHLVSRTTLDGKPYPDSAEGRMAHYRDFVKLARSKGIRIIQDVVLNHAGPVFFYDSNKNGSFDTQTREEWVLPFKRDGFHDNAVWADVPKWNARRTQPDGPRELLGAQIATTGVLSRLDTYGRKGFSDGSLGQRCGEEVMCDFFSLRDFWTEPNSPHFDALVDEFVEIYQFYMTTVGVDGLRVDTVKHAHHELWDAFTARLREQLGPAAKDKLLFGEVYDGDPAVLGKYTWRTDWNENPGPSLDSVLDFDFCFSARQYLRHPGDQYGSPAALEKSLLTRFAEAPDGRPYYNPNPGPDGFNARDKMITFIENHDGLNRFRVKGVTEVRNRLAQGLVMTLPGIPCIYYGTEFALHDTVAETGWDTETGRMTFFSRKNGPTQREVRESAPFREFSELAALRARMPALRTGHVIPLWVDAPDHSEDDGVFAFGRLCPEGKSIAIIVINASSIDRVTAAGEHVLTLPGELNTLDRVVRPVLAIGAGDMPKLDDPDAAGPLRLPAPASTMVVYEVVKAEE
jgi:glycosidase